MKIAYIGRVSLKLLAEQFQFERKLPDVKWGFPLGSEIVAGLVRRGHEVHVVTEHTVEKIEMFQVAGCGKLVVHLVPSWKRSRWMFLTLFAKEVRGMRRVVREIEPDVVFAQWTYHNAYAGLTSGCPTLVVAHDSPWRIAWANRSMQAWIKALYAQLFVFPLLRNVCAVSSYIVDELRYFNRYKGAISVIPNGLHITQKTRRQIIRRDACTIVCVSQWDRRKNPQSLIEAFVLLRERHPNWKLIMFGQGLDAELAGKWIVQHNLKGDGITLRGQMSRKEIEKFLSGEADVFCSPTREESFGMIFIEAMNCGIPCVGGEKSGAVPWVLGNGDAGVLTDVTKPDVLAQTLERVLLDYELRKRLSEAGLKRVKENFDIERVIDMYEKELKRVAGIR